jgi:hypothetical protein
LPSKETQNKKTSNELSFAESTKNLAMNVFIFLLAIVVLYLGYSIFLKISDKTGRIADKKNNTQVASDIIQLEVMNGCGITGVADRVTDFLRDNGFDVVNNGNYKSFDVENTIVVDRIGNIANAKKVARSIGVSEKKVIQQINEEYFLDVSVIIGKDFYSLEPFK